MKAFLGNASKKVSSFRAIEDQRPPSPRGRQVPVMHAGQMMNNARPRVFAIFGAPTEIGHQRDDRDDHFRATHE